MAWPDKTEGRADIRAFQKLTGDPLLGNALVARWSVSAAIAALPFVVLALAAFVITEPSLPSAAPRPPDLVQEHAVYRADLLLFTAVVFFLIVAAAVYFANERVVIRHISHFWTHDVRFRLQLTTICALALGGGLTYLSGNLMPWIAAPPEGDRIALAIFISATPVFLVCASSTFGTWVTAAHFPDPISVKKHVVFSGDQDKDYLFLPPDLVKYEDYMTSRAKGLVLIGSPGFLGPETYAKGALACWNAATEFNRFAFEETVTRPADYGLRPKHLIEIINGLTYSAVVVVVLSLVVLEFGFGAAEARLALPDAELAAVIASNDAWILSLGVGYSLLIGLLHVPPIARLRPYELASEAMEKAQSAPVAEGEPLPVETEFPFEMARHMGADRQKFDLIILGNDYGGGLQGFMQESFSKHLTRILGVVAPLIASTALAFFG